jgi:hypothetical protein
MEELKIPDPKQKMIPWDHVLYLPDFIDEETI